MGSDHDLELSEFAMRDKVAQRQLEFVIGADRVVRINVDGLCALRVRLAEGCDLHVRNDIAEYVSSLIDGARWKG